MSESLAKSLSNEEKAPPLSSHEKRLHGETVAVLEAHDGVNRESGFVGKLWRLVTYLDSFGVEVRFTISTFSLGTLGNFMSLTDAALTIVFFNLLTTIPVAIFSTWGKSTGLRQMVLGRYSFGWAAIWFPIALNCIACIGWSVINTIVGSSALRAVSTSHQLPQAAGIVVIALLTLVFALFGYKQVHNFERWASVPVIIIMIIMLGEGAPHMTSAPMASGPIEAANVLSFGGTIAGFALGWTSLAADYTVNFPVETSSTKVFIYTYIGLNTTFDSKPSWGALYDDNGLGGLLYSFALTFQAFGKFAQAIPRIFLVCIGTVIYIVLAIVGATHFESWLDTLLVILSYWLAIYSTILIWEHFYFRGGKWSNYDLDGFNNHAVLPVGYAAGLATAFGILGAVLGMAQTWYVGVIGKKIGDPIYGGDIGFELSAAFSGITYPVR
ncbi:hypothetical protein RQP46_007673 [Phenoliferia psychrophenolica]